MKILILGKGFIGNHLNSFLQKNNFNIVHVSHNELNYHDSAILSNYLDKNSFDFVVNCAGYTGRPNVDGCEDHKSECTLLNVTVPTILNHVCDTRNIKLIHISSGCIYTGYDKIFDELDEPNFGLFNPESSFYSKTKHIFECVTKPFLHNTAVLRIRMPFTGTTESKNYLIKILNYSDLIDYKNSLTYVEDLCRFVLFLTSNFKGGLFNVVNDIPMSANDLLPIFKNNNTYNIHWKIVPISDLKIKANRSNCILTNNKVKSLGFSFTDTLEAVDKCIKQFIINR